MYKEVKKVLLSIEENLAPEDYEWLGVIYSADKRSNSELITPLAYYNYHEWLPITQNERRQLFPDNDKVVHFKNNGEYPLETNRLYQFKIKHITPNQQEIYNYSQYATNKEVEEDMSLIQILNWTSSVNIFFDLPSLLEKGISVTNCLKNRIYVLYQNYFYGPIQLEQDQNNPHLLKPREYLQAPSNGGKPLMLAKHFFENANSLILDNKEFIDKNTLGSSLSQSDWSLPQVVIKRVLQASNHLSAREGAEHLIDKRIKELVAFHGSDGLQIDESTIQRAQDILSRQIPPLQELHILLEELPVEHPLLEKARVLEIQRRKEEIERQISQEREAEQQYLQTLRDNIRLAQEKLRKEQESLRKVVAETEQAKQNHVQEQTEFALLEEFMQKRLAQMRQEPLRLLADLHLLTALPSNIFPPLSTAVIEDAQLISSSSTPKSGYFFSSGDAIWTNSQKLPLSDTSKQCNASLKYTRICASALLAGLIPSIDEPRAFAALQATAQAITGNRIWSVPIPVTALSPLDLFGTLILEQQRFVPSAGDLADILFETLSYPEQLGIVVLEGVDRVPFLPVIAPLLQHYRAIQQVAQWGGRVLAQQTSLCLFHPRALSANDSYQYLSRLSWPANLLLAVTLDNSAGSFLLPETHTSWFVRLEPKKGKRSELQEQKYWQMRSEDWYTWEREILQQVANGIDASIPEEISLQQKMFCTALPSVGIKNQNLSTFIEQLWPEMSTDVDA